MQVEVLSEGDFVNELLILVGGMVEVLRPGADGAEELSLASDGHSSMRGTCIRHVPFTSILYPEPYSSHCLAVLSNSQVSMRGTCIRRVLPRLIIFQP